MTTSLTHHDPESIAGNACSTRQERAFLRTLVAGGRLFSISSQFPDESGLALSAFILAVQDEEKNRWESVGKADNFQIKKWVRQ
ncbi:MAG TPA: hypothetical protein VMW38_12065 [Terriglobia bacterium]|nr:hypothetical protein [Terriglobia bacterium]